MLRSRNDRTGILLILGSQIVSFLGKDRMVEFLGLKTNEERISFMYRHEAYRPLLQVLLKYIWSPQNFSFIEKIAILTNWIPHLIFDRGSHNDVPDHQEGCWLIRKGGKRCNA